MFNHGGMDESEMDYSCSRCPRPLAQPVTQQRPVFTYATAPGTSNAPQPRPRRLLYNARHPSDIAKTRFDISFFGSRLALLAPSPFAHSIVC